MGQFLSEPDEEIHEGEGTGNGLTYVGIWIQFLKFANKMQNAKCIVICMVCVDVSNFVRVEVDQCVSSY